MNYNDINKKIINQLIAKINDYAADKAKDVARGAETPRLAALLLQKYGFGMIEATKIIFDRAGTEYEDFHIKDSLWAALESEAAKIDPEWRKNNKIRWNARPADLSYEKKKALNERTDQRDVRTVDDDIWSKNYDHLDSIVEPYDKWDNQNDIKNQGAKEALREVYLQLLQLGFVSDLLQKDLLMFELDQWNQTLSNLRESIDVHDYCKACKYLRDYMHNFNVQQSTVFYTLTPVLSDILDVPEWGIVRTADDKQRATQYIRNRISAASAQTANIINEKYETSDAKRYLKWLPKVTSVLIEELPHMIHEYDRLYDVVLRLWEGSALNQLRELFNFRKMYERLDHGIVQTLVFTITDCLKEVPVMVSDRFDEHLTTADAAGNWLIVGKSGSGKTELTKKIIISEIAKGSKVFMLDWKRDYKTNFYPAPVNIVDCTDRECTPDHIASRCVEGQITIFDLSQYDALKMNYLEDNTLAVLSYCWQKIKSHNDSRYLLVVDEDYIKTPKVFSMLADISKDIQKYNSTMILTTFSMRDIIGGTNEPLEFLKIMHNRFVFCDCDWSIPDVKQIYTKTLGLSHDQMRYIAHSQVGCGVLNHDDKNVIVDLRE